MNQMPSTAKCHLLRKLCHLARFGCTHGKYHELRNVNWSGHSCYCGVWDTTHKASLTLQRLNIPAEEGVGACARQVGREYLCSNNPPYGSSAEDASIPLLSPGTRIPATAAAFRVQPKSERPRIEISVHLNILKWSKWIRSRFPGGSIAQAQLQCIKPHNPPRMHRNHRD